MRIRLAPGRPLIVALVIGTVAVLLALVARVPSDQAFWLAAGWMLTLALLALLDYAWTRSAWRSASVTLTRRLPPALALGVQRRVQLHLAVGGSVAWQVRLYDHADATLHTDGLPAQVSLQPGKVTM